ncbi:hypothetical protein [Jeotgalicoccus psychrophilus]|uniref:hypothetical protein n=1 Tax=Jeotgalicoccus psychrophilus TaxID=157228 RepID=UPI000401AA0E|nr:hypothetical protein [Jeotgalicoccus psychrophilus]
MTDESTNAQQSDGVTVDVQTGERSDEQQYEIIEHEGVKYVAANQADLYKAAKSEELAAMQTEIDDTLSAIEEIDGINAVEKRQAEMQSLIKRFGEDEYSGLMDVTDFTNEYEVQQTILYITAAYQSSFGNPSAGFGAAKEAEPANSYKNQYEYGQKIARQAYEKRRR